MFFSPKGFFFFLSCSSTQTINFTHLTAFKIDLSTSSVRNKIHRCLTHVNHHLRLPLDCRQRTVHVSDFEGCHPVTVAARSVAFRLLVWLHVVLPYIVSSGVNKADCSLWRIFMQIRSSRLRTLAAIFIDGLFLKKISNASFFCYHEFCPSRSRSQRYSQLATWRLP